MQREVRDQLRDRRTLFMIAVLPLLLYPLMGMSFMQVTQFLKKTPSRVLVMTEGPLPSDPPLIQDGQFVGMSPQATRLIDLEIQKTQLPENLESFVSNQITEKSYDLIICLEHAQDESARNPAPQLFFDAARDPSRIAKERVSTALTHWRNAIFEKNLADHELTLEDTTPAQIAANNVATPQLARAAMWSKVLPFVALIWALTGAFYPAVDLCAGEKERGTLETLLSSPAERSEIVCGKLLTIMVFSLSTACLNLMCMMGTATFAIGRIQHAMPGAPMGNMGAPPLAALGWVLIALIPISALFSALALALATMARSTKEGQYYLMPLLLICMPLMMLAVFPSAELNLGSSIVPVTGLLLLLRQLMEGNFYQALLYVTPVAIVTGGCVLLAIRWAIDQFNNESVLFRDGERFDLGIWLVHLVRDRTPTPGVAAGVLCGVLLLLIRFFASMALPTPQTWTGFAQITAITMIAFVASPALLMAIMLTTNPRKTLLVQRPTTWWTVPAAFLLAICLHPFAMGMSIVLRTVYPVDESALKPLTGIFEQAPNTFAVVLLLAVLPAICEEFAFRGFILSGLRHMGHKWRAILFSSLFFGIAHGMLQQSIMAATFGMLIGYIAVQSGSLFPCIAFHATHNALSFLSAEWIPLWTERLPENHWLFIPIQTASEMTPTLYCYGPFVILCGFVLATGLIRWFQQLPYLPTEEEKFIAALSQQHIPHPDPALAQTSPT